MKEIFVFGAGASAASAGTPLGPELVWTYPSDCFDPCGEFNDFRELLKSDPKFKKFFDGYKKQDKAITLPVLIIEKKYYIDELINDL